VPPPVTLLFPRHTVEWHPDRQLAITRFSDGSEAHACPHDTPEYHGHAEEKSTGDIGLYCFQHDLVHVALAEIEGRVSPTLWAIAHGQPDNTSEIADEERRVAEFQKAFFLRSNGCLDLSKQH